MNSITPNYRFITKYDVNGNFKWTKTFPGSVNENYQDPTPAIAIDSIGNIYLSGIFRGIFGDKLDFDPGPDVFYLKPWRKEHYASENTSDIYILKFDSDGNFIWAKGIGGQFRDNVSAFCLDGRGNVYLCGDFRSTVDFDPGPDTVNLSTDNDIANNGNFILKLNSDGNFVWVKQFNSTIYSMAIDNIENYI